MFDRSARASAPTRAILTGIVLDVAALLASLAAVLENDWRPLAIMFATLIGTSLLVSPGE